MADIKLLLSRKEAIALKELLQSCVNDDNRSGSDIGLCKQLIIPIDRLLNKNPKETFSAGGYR